MVIVLRKAVALEDGGSLSKEDINEYVKEENSKPKYLYHLGNGNPGARTFTCWNLLLLALLLMYARVMGNNNESVSSPTTADVLSDKGIEVSATKLREVARSRYENCTISFIPPPPRQQASEWRKPLWVPSFPASGSASPTKKGDLTKELIDALTGLSQATKNYHMSIKGGKLRRCYGISETAACTQGHPYVHVGPELQTSNFQPSVIFAIRNFMTAFPASHTDKNMAYHGAKGQAPEEQWRKVRDQYVESSMESWRSVIRWWRTAEYYKIVLYLPFEWLLYPTKGPGLVQQLANNYQKAGFEVASPEDIPCIWYEVASKEWKRQEELNLYTPGYTKEQQIFILNQLDEQIEEIKDDTTLTSILLDYKKEVMHNTKFDHLAEAHATSDTE